MLKTALTHARRAALNSLFVDKVAEVVRAAFFGRHAAVNRAAHTDLADPSGMVTAPHRLRVF